MNETVDIAKLKFPIGKFEKPDVIKSSHIESWANEIEAFPSRLVALVADVSGEQLAWRYRPGGWSIRQVVHHLADSHMNAFIRFKLALTEESPVIKPYAEDKWALMPDVTGAPVEESLEIIGGLHLRWARLIRSLNEGELKKEYVHPGYGRRFVLDEAAGLYAWHSNHHFAHIEQALRSGGSY